ncbi:hypothetical protein L1065_07930 [Nereida sp. MMG024]|nr:hypothetical protein [Nereida sp. MMG025]
MPATERTTEVQELRRAFETIARMPKEVQLLLLPMLLSQVQNTKDNDLAAEISVYVQDLQTPSEGRINGIANDPEAIRQKIEAQIDALQPIGDADKTLLASFITQMRGSDKVVPLIKTQTRMYLHGAQLNLALEKIREHGLSQNTYADLISRAVKGATDLEFLTVIDRTKDQSPEFDGDEESQRVIAQRFLDLGFGKAAMSWAETLPSSAVNDILKAQIYLALNQPRAARDVLVGHNVAKAKELRLQADLLAGDRVQAMQSAALIEDEKAVQKALTRMGAWDDLSLLPAEAPLVRVQQSTTQVQDLADKRSLTDSQKLLEASRIAREGIGQILSTEPELNLTNN